MFLTGLLVLLCASLSSTVKVLTWPPLSCPRQDLKCTVKESNCMDKGWLKVNEYTPSGPEALQVSVDTRRDERGHLHPVLNATWKLKEDGSIHFLKATELQVLMLSTNQNLCVRYSIKDNLKMKSPSGEQWSFSANMVVLDPGQRYLVSVFNIPKPEMDHRHYDVRADITVPDCQDSRMKMTQFCIERGSLWQPNISMALVGASSALAVSFSPDQLCEKYMVIVKCPAFQPQVHRVNKGSHTTLNATFSLDKWPSSCCQFEASIKPLFPQCGNDCARFRETLNICRVTPTEAPDDSSYVFIILGVVFISVLMAVALYVCCRNRGKVPEADEVHVIGENSQQIKQAPTVLVIYSQDHYLYRDIVLKLCAFLKIKCGTKVVVDLLDTTSVGMVGRVRWLEWQRQQMKNPSDKILVLCSKGVQAKWRALCGHDQVTLREDVLSPTDDMLTPFLHLFLPDMHQAGMLGKYMVAYFDDISSEEDVPSVFDITVKFKLMKHFEELFFRIVDIEKYQPRHVKHIEGIGGDEYFNCPSGRDLKNAIETFKAYQLENPDWFERQCVQSEEEVMTEANTLIENLQIPPVLECLPLIREGPPVYVRELEVAENESSVHVLTPELNPRQQLPSVVELQPIVNSVHGHRYPSGLEQVLPDHMYPHSPRPESVYILEPVLNRPPPLRQNLLPLDQELRCQIPIEDNEEASPLSKSQVYADWDPRSSVLQNSLDSSPPGSSCTSMQSEYYPPSQISHSTPVEMEEDETVEPSGSSCPNSGSDQGYISKVSSQQERPLKEDPLAALAKLQEELFQQNIRYSDTGPEEN